MKTMTTTNVASVAYFLLRTHGHMSTMKLQKLTYYCQAYSLAWLGEPLFQEEIKAWTNGPVIPDLRDSHSGKFKVSYVDFENNHDKLDSDQEKICQAVLEAFSGLTGWELKERTQSEKPWKMFFDEYSEKHNTTILHSTMQDYYQ